MNYYIYFELISNIYLYNIVFINNLPSQLKNSSSAIVCVGYRLEMFNAILILVSIMIYFCVDHLMIQNTLRRERGDGFIFHSILLLQK